MATALATDGMSGDAWRNDYVDDRDFNRDVDNHTYATLCELKATRVECSQCTVKRITTHTENKGV